MSVVEIIFTVLFVISVFAYEWRLKAKDRDIKKKDDLISSLMTKNSESNHRLFQELSKNNYSDLKIEKISVKMEMESQQNDYRHPIDFRFSLEEKLRHLKESLFEEACKHIEIESNNLLERSSFCDREIVVSMYIGVDKNKDNVNQQSSLSRLHG